MRVALRLIWIAAGVAVLLGSIRDRVLALVSDATLVPRFETTAGAWFAGGFRVNGAYPTTEAGALPPNVPHSGSWLDTDEWQGETATVWFAAKQRSVRVGVAGYPQLPGCQLRAEFRTAEGAMSRLDCAIANPRERWGIWKIDLPRGAVAFRLLAEDHNAGHAGWIAFSHPFTSWKSEVTTAYQFAQVGTTTALALLLIWGPGLWWATRRHEDGRTGSIDADADHPSWAWHAVTLMGAGPLVLAVVGLVGWTASGQLSPQTAGKLAVVLIWSALGLAFARRGFELALRRDLRRVLAIVALVTVAVVAKSSYSGGPKGELFGGTVSRNFEMADRIDSRYSFYVVQAAAHHWSPIAVDAEKLFAPWTFFSRGPLAGLTVAPVVFATNGRPPKAAPEDRWSPFDATGFAAYRIAMIALAGSIVVAVFVLLVPLAGSTWAWIGAGLLALSPFGLHEMMFTWPKWVATSWLTLSFVFAHARRPGAAGLMLGIGFLFHPLVLLWSPWVGAWAAARGGRGVTPFAKTLLQFGAAAAVIVLPWMALGAVAPHLSTTPLPGQIGFLQYWARADWHIATWDSWWRTRWMNFANTFVPLHVYLSPTSYHHPKLSSAYEVSGPLVRFSQVWWNSLPFAMGLGLWALSLAAIGRGLRTFVFATGLFVILPALFITAYWGMDPLGLMRECGHPLFVTLIALTCVVAARGGWLANVLLHPAAPWLQLPETLLMLWLTTFVNPGALAVDNDGANAAYFTIHVTALAAAAWILVRARRNAVAAPASAATAPACSREKKMPRGAWMILALAVVAVVVSPFRFRIEETTALTPISPGETLTANGAFKPEGATASDRFEELPPGLPVLGSHLEAEDFRGAHESGWFVAAPKISVMVGGYPLAAGNTLALETRRSDGATTRIPYDVHDVGDAWLRWTVKLPTDAAAVRVVAADDSTGAGGWLAFSAPFTTRPLLAAQAWSGFQLLAVACLSVTLIFGPGLLWFGRRDRPLASLAFAVLPGPLLLVALGLWCWLLGGMIAPITAARIGVAVILGGIGWVMWQRRGGDALPRPLLLVVAASALLAGFAVAKANISFGPRGELFRDRVSRTLEVGHHSDSQISFHVVQMVAHHLGPYDPQTRLYFAPWRFASRGPLAGFMAAPVVLATAAKVPFDHPTHPWRPFDREGFAVYRIACITLATMASWVVVGLVAALASTAWAMAVAAFALLAPFFVHEVYFTWPKLMAGALVLAAFLASRQQRPFVSGLMLALGYLFHPLAALSAPFLGIWMLAQRTDRTGWRRLIAPAWLVAGALVLVVPWQIVGRLRPDEGANQDIFAQYFFYADSAHATAATWWKSRWDNFAHTFVPGYLLTADPAHESLNSAYEPSDRWVQASFLWWNTLPLALGIPGFLLAALALATGCRRGLRVVLATLIAPALFLIAYWGAASTGLMRQCGHALFLSVIVVTIWTCARWPSSLLDNAVAAFLHPACFAWRGFEIALMAFGVTLMNWRHDFSDLFRWNDAVSLVAALGCLIALVMVLARGVRSEFPRAPLAAA